MALHGRDQRVADFVIGNRPLFLVGKDGILLLIARDDHLDGLFHVRLGGEFPSVPDGAQRRFVDDIGKLRAGRAGGHSGDRGKVHPVGQTDLLGVDLLDVDAAL